MFSSEHLKGLTPFLATADAGSFTKAAERLHLSSSAVSKSVARLRSGWACCCSSAARAG
jgi:DNA-binding transcriptional LysR family regulator